MPKKDKGWDYLKSDDVNETFNSNDDGSWGYKNGDGSGSYYYDNAGGHPILCNECGLVNGEKLGGLICQLLIEIKKRMDWRFLLKEYHPIPFVPN